MTRSRIRSRSNSATAARLRLPCHDGGSLIAVDPTERQERVRRLSVILKDIRETWFSATVRTVEGAAERFGCLWTFHVMRRNLGEPVESAVLAFQLLLAFRSLAQCGLDYVENTEFMDSLLAMTAGPAAPQVAQYMRRYGNLDIPQAERFSFDVLTYICDDPDAFVVPLLCRPDVIALTAETESAVGESL